MSQGDQDYSGGMLGKLTASVDGLQASIDALIKERDGLKEEVKSYAEKLTASRSTVAFQKEEIDRLCFRTVEEAAILAADARIRQLEKGIDKVISWNHRVSVCVDHAADIVDGLCVICERDRYKAAVEWADKKLRKSSLPFYETEELADELRKRAGMEGI